LHLVIGAGEFLAGHVTRALSADVPVIELPAAAEGETLDDAISGVQVVVFAAQTVSPGRRVRYRRRPPASLQHAIEAARRARVKRLVHVSTADVYGTDHVGRVNRRTPLKPAHAYERAKLFEEEWLLEAAGPVEVVIIRPARVFGEGEDWFLPRLVAAAVRGRVWLPGGGRALQSFISAEDVGRACLAASDRGRPGHRYLVRGFDSTWRELVICAARAVGFAAEVGSVPIDLPYLTALAKQVFTRRGALLWPGPFGVDVLGRSRHYDDSYSRRELTWSPSVGSFEQEIPAMTRWLMSLPEVTAALAAQPARQAGVTSPPGR
jgi:nucleoside-diphosphate-sugar epimerase